MFSRKTLFCFTKTKMTHKTITKRNTHLTGFVALFLIEKAIENYFEKKYEELRRKRK